MKFDSKLEEKVYTNVLLPKVKSKEITKLKRLDRYKDYIIVNPAYIVLKNGKKSKIQAMKYTPDFTFYDSDGKFIYLEVKSSWTKKKSDYKMRMKLFIRLLKPNEIFIECIESKKNQYKYITYKPLE